ncbi:MAG: alanine racemase [bacterium]
MRISRTATNAVIINKNKIKENIKNIKKHFPYKIISVLKSNAYGLGINNILPTIINDVYKVAINSIEEYFEYDLFSYPVDFIILFPEIEKDLIDDVIKYSNVILNITSLEFLKVLSSFSRNRIKVYLEVDTGMNRTGIKYNERISLNGNWELAGIFTHLKNGNVYDNIEQISKFFDFIKNNSIYLQGLDVSILASTGLVNYEKILNIGDDKIKYVLNISNSVRVGIFQYGIASSMDYIEFKHKLGLSNSIRFKVGFLGTKIVKKGETVGYTNTNINSCVIDKDKLIGLAYVGYSKLPFCKEIFFEVITNKRRFITKSIGMLSMDVVAFELGNIDFEEEVRELLVISENIEVERQAYNNNLPVYNFLTSFSSIKKYLE